MEIIGALDPLENETEGVPGRDEEVGLSRWNDENVDIRRNHDDLAVPVPVPIKSGSGWSLGLSFFWPNAATLQSSSPSISPLLIPISDSRALCRANDAD